MDIFNECILQYYTIHIWLTLEIWNHGNGDCKVTHRFSTMQSICTPNPQVVQGSTVFIPCLLQVQKLKAVWIGLLVSFLFFWYHSYVYHSPHIFWGILLMFLGFSVGLDSKESACNAGDLGLNPGSGRSPEEGNGNPLQYSCLKNSMDRGTW